MNPATEYVHASREVSPIRAYVADHGESMDRSAVEHVTIAGCPVAVSNTLTDDERALIADAIRATEPVPKACFANAFELWAYDSRFRYAEGFAVAADLDVGGIKHAWCLLDGETLVDVTMPFDHYHGVVFGDDDILQQHYDIGQEHDVYGVLGNHRTRFEFLREQGYIDG